MVAVEETNGERQPPGSLRLCGIFVILPERLLTYKHPLLDLRTRGRRWVPPRSRDIQLSFSTGPGWESRLLASFLGMEMAPSGLPVLFSDRRILPHA